MDLQFGHGGWRSVLAFVRWAEWGMEKKELGEKKQTYILLCTDYCVTLPHSIYRSS